MGERAVVIGLDSLPARLAFGAWRSLLPNLSALAGAGWEGTLRSVDPPLTVPAWACLATGADPGALGLYGFRDRADRSYERRSLAGSSRVRLPTLWDRLAARGRPAVVIGVPPSYPPRALPGQTLVCDFLAPGTDVTYTSPPELARAIRRCVGRYPLDVESYRAPDKQRIVCDCREMIAAHFEVARELMRSRPWDLFFLVEIGLDRLQHAMLGALDPAHPRFDPSRPGAREALECLRELDAGVGSLLELAGEETPVVVLSDHGARPLRGGFRLNEWLRREGYLVLRDDVARPVPFDPARVDWDRTRAWADGGYVGRIHLNVRGREPRGVLAPAEVERVLDELSQALAELRGPEGEPAGAATLRPQQRYPVCRGVPPDLWVYVGGLDWRVIGSVGPGSLWPAENDTGPDDANHDHLGIVIGRGAPPPGNAAACGRAWDAAGWDLLDMHGWIAKTLELEPSAPRSPGPPILGTRVG